MNPNHQSSTIISIVAALIAFAFSSATISTSDAQLFGFGKRSAGRTSSETMLKARAAMTEKISIQAHQGRFVIDFPKNDDGTELGQSIIDNAYSNTHSANGGNFFCQTESDVARFIINAGTDRWGQPSKDTKSIKLTDLTDTANFVKIDLDEANNRLSMISLNLAQEHIHIVRQTNDKLVLVASEGDSFDYMSDQTINNLVAETEFATLIDRFRTAGLGLPKVAQRSSIESLIESILNFSDADRKKFESAFPDLTSTKFKLRKEAAKSLSKQLDKHVVAVSAMLLSDNLPLETRARFIEAIDASDDESSVLMINTIVGGKLNQSPGILVNLLNQQIQSKAPAESVRNTIEQLEKCTDQSFGDNVEAWSNWNKKSQSNQTKRPPTSGIKKETNTKETTESAKPPGKTPRRRLRKTGREQVQQPLKDLLHLKIDDQGNIVIDRGHWKRIFLDQTPGQVIKNARQSFEDSGLPKSWLKMGGDHNIAGLGYEQILFERISDDVKVRSETFDQATNFDINKTKSLNRTMYKSGLQMTLMVHPEGDRWADLRKNRAFFKFLFEDEAEDLFYLLTEDPKKGFSIFVFSNDGETVLNLRCNSNGEVKIHHVFQQQKTLLSAKSVSNLLEEHRVFVNTQILPLLDRVGISAENAFNQFDD